MTRCSRILRALALLFLIGSAGATAHAQPVQGSDQEQSGPQRELEKRRDAEEAARVAARVATGKANTRPYEEFLAAVINGDAAAVTKFLNNGIDVNYRDRDPGWGNDAPLGEPEGYTALHYLFGARRRALGMGMGIRPFGVGSNQNYTGDVGPNKRGEVLQVLLARGADANARDKSGNTPLMMAMQQLWQAAGSFPRYPYPPYLLVEAPEEEFIFDLFAGREEDYQMTMTAEDIVRFNALKQKQEVVKVAPPAQSEELTKLKEQQKKLMQQMRSSDANTRAQAQKEYQKLAPRIVKLMQEQMKGQTTAAAATDKEAKDRFEGQKAKVEAERAALLKAREELKQEWLKHADEEERKLLIEAEADAREKQVLLTSLAGSDEAKPDSTLVRRFKELGDRGENRREVFEEKLLKKRQRFDWEHNFVDNTPYATHLLLARGAQMNDTTRKDIPPASLHYAVLMGHVEQSRRLLAQGVSVNAPEGRPDHLATAAQAGQTATALLLMEKGADPFNDRGMFLPIGAAIEKHNAELVHAMLAASPTPVLPVREDVAGNSVTFLSHAIEAYNRSYSETEGMKPLKAAAIQSRAREVVAMVLEKSDPADIRNSLYTVAVAHVDMPEVAELLLKKGADPRAFNGNHAALFAAARTGKLDVLRVLLDHGVNVNARREIGQTTLLMEAVSGPNALNVVTLLLKRGADPNLKDKDGRTALSFAKQESGVAQLLIKAGAKE